MTERRQINDDIHHRRQVCGRITDLKTSCENLHQVRDNLMDRLRGLNEIVDKLILEKKQNKYDPNLMVQSISHKPDKFSNLTSKRDNQSRPLTSTFATNDLTSKDNLSNRLQQITSKSAPSEAFKIKLSLCLREVVEKAEEIAELSEHLATTGNPQ